MCALKGVNANHDLRPREHWFLRLSQFLEKIPTNLALKLARKSGAHVVSV